MRSRSILIASPVLAAAAIAGTALADDDTTTTTTREPLGIEALGEVFFPFDSARSAGDASGEIGKIAEYAKTHPDRRIVLDSYTDTTGDPAYNVALAIRRGKTVESKLVAAGVDPDKIVIVSYGEDGLRRTSDQYDRRVTVWATDDPLHEIVAHSLEDGTAVIWEEPVTAAELEGPRTPVATR
jgi:outer membrane protein OmpA-like peptidoglycan-associated protein